MIDTHCHLTYRGLIEQVDQVVDRARGAGVDRMITVGIDPQDGRRALDLTERFDGVYSTVGVHPHYAGRWTDRSVVVDAMSELTALPRVVACGEMGIDTHYDDPPLSAQVRVLGWQLEWASERSSLPLIIHSRQSTTQLLERLRSSGIGANRFVFHCFTGNDEELDAVLEFGAMVSFTGIITFKNAKQLAASAARVPIDRLMLETDAPYLTPEPRRKQKTNQPCNVTLVATFLARQRRISTDSLIDATDANAVRFFQLE